MKIKKKTLTALEKFLEKLTEQEKERLAMALMSQEKKIAMEIELPKGIMGTHTPNKIYDLNRVLLEEIVSVLENPGYRPLG